MTKNDEIQLLLEASIKLGSNSYCGPWLNEQIPYIEHDMRCDIMPTPTWSETRKLHDSTVTLAKDQAERIIRLAKKEAEEIVQDAENKADNLRKWVQRDIQKALDAII